MKKNIQLYMKKTVFLALNLLLAVFITRFFIMEPGRISGQSMEPTFFDGEVFLVNKLTLLFRAPRKNDIIQIINPVNNKELLIKRVIGLPNEEVNIGEQNIFVPDDSYFVVGDNAAVSYDSLDFGPVNRRLIIGLVNKMW